MSLTPSQAAEHRTPDDHINAVKALAEKIKSEAFIANCIVDDWGRFSNFQLMVAVDKHEFNTVSKGILTRKINAVFDRILKETGAHRRETFSPIANYRWCGYEKKRILEGYDRTYWVVDIDFHKFNAASNSFDC